MHNKRNRTPSKHIGYGLYLYFRGLSYRSTPKALSRFAKRSHVAIWKWIQRCRPKKITAKRKRISEFVIDETLLKAGSNYIWIWVAIEPKAKKILGISMSNERNMLTAERFILSLMNKYGKHPVSTDGGTWYPRACRSLNTQHHIHSPYEKSLIERTMQYIKDRTEGFDDYFPCRLKNCKLKHVQKWLNLFIDQHNREMMA
jgi:putative transposase